MEMSSTGREKESLKKTVCDYKTHIKQITALQRETVKSLKEIQDLINSRSQGNESLFSLPVCEVPEFNSNHLPCVLFIGSQNCGKTTLLNVFLGQHILPTHENPCTARLVRIVQSSSDNYVSLVDPQGNKQEPKPFKSKVPKKYIVLEGEDRKDSEKLKMIVEVRVKDIELLKCGIELIDSPGLNENESLNRVVEEFIRKGVVPLIVYVVDGKNQLQKSDRTTIRELQSKFPNVSLMFVCSKVDVERKAHNFDKDSDDEDNDDGFERSQKIKYNVFKSLKSLDFLPSDAEIGACPLFHGVSAKNVKLARKKNLKNAATMSFEDLELCIFEKLESSLRKESKRVISRLLSAQEMILTSVVNKQTTFSITTSLSYESYQSAVDKQLSVFSMILELILKTKSITNTIGLNLQNLAVTIIKEGEQYQFTTNSKRNEVLAEEFCREIRGSILDRSFNVLRRSVKVALRKSIAESAFKVEAITKAIGHPLISRLMQRTVYESEYRQQKKNIGHENFLKKCAMLEGILQSFTDTVDFALRKEISQNLCEFRLEEVGPNPPKPKDSSWRRKVVQTLLSKIDCKRLSCTVVETCKAALMSKQEEFTRDANNFRSINEVLSAPDVKSMIRRLRSDYAPHVAELAVRGHALQYVIERGGAPELEERIKCTAHGQLYYCSSPLWCADSERCVVKVITKSTVGTEVWNQTMRDCMHTVDIVEKFGTSCKYFLRLNGWFLPEPEKLYIVMEEAKEDLLTALQRGMTWEKRLSVALDVASGVSAIHKTNYVYQDLKPQNVMLSVDGTAKVNLCKPEKPFETTKLGIPFHISPKMFHNYKDGYSDISYDIYAFGSLLWVLCEGSGHSGPQVYSGCHDIKAIWYAVCDEGIRPERPPETPDEWWNLIVLCWKDDTPTTIQTVLEQLRLIH